MKHKKCKGIVQKIWVGKDEHQLRCAYCHKQVKEEDTYRDD